jgi:DNA uptake protein ComE-like DNA-binding protein
MKHPYIEYYLAKSIVNYREQKGKYTNVEDIKKAVHFYDELYQKIEPYLSVE